MARTTHKKQKPSFLGMNNITALLGVLVIIVAIIVFIFIARQNANTSGLLTSKGGTQIVTTRIAQAQRTYRVYAPQDYSSEKSYPLVFVFHGGGGNGKHMEEVSRFSELAEREKFIVIYPDGVKQETGWLKNNDLGRTWNAVHCCGFAYSSNSDDISFVTQILTEVSKTFTVDTEKVYATGFSNGGMFAYRLVTETNNLFAKVAVVGGAIGGRESSQAEQKVIERPSEPISVLIIHGVLDKHVKYLGGESEGVDRGRTDISVADTTQFWRLANGCNADPATENRGNSTTKVTYSNCVNNTALVIYSLKAQGHAWPGSQETNSYLLGITDRPSKDIDATQVIWEFFKTE
ncbi:MAG: PHB depolymerase family esterase [Candidatus Dojkabacteria bacterium]|nr:MAG: PHB depolymerase family esterase [Candidatus Dojkabacteria bacterium]